MTSRNKWLISIGSLVALGTALYFLLCTDTDEQEEEPPKNAPQLDIDNPGTQNDFLASPTDSEVG